MPSSITSVFSYFYNFFSTSFSPFAPDKYKDFPALQSDIVHSSLLEELIFWTFKYEFPQNFVCFLLNMLPDPEYKVIQCTVIR